MEAAANPVADRLTGAMAEQGAILLAGPTASGKSALALALAETCDGVVINADSMQVYGELRILTARPGPDEEARIPHRLYGHVAAQEGYSVGRWLEDAAAALAEVRESGRIPIFVGGTGLYFKALTEGLSPMPSVPAALREMVHARLAAQGVRALHAELEARDPSSAAALPPTDSQRIVRAIEVLEATGRPLSAWQSGARQGALLDPARARRIVLWPDREALKARIEARVDEMLAGGVLEEVRAVARLDLAPKLPAFRAHGLRALLAHIRGEMPLSLAADTMRKETKRYAKRQFTWFRHQMSDWERLHPESALAALSR
jgi:tRNA dimethylallyltransferase